MNKLLEQLRKHFESVRMTASESSRVKNAISSYIDNWEPEEQETPYFKFTLGYFSKRTLQTVAVVLIFMLTLGTGLAQASEDALPGDILYPVKITSEDIASFFTTDAERKIDWEIERTERRMEEALKLALRQKLDDSIQEEISKKIQQHTLAINNEIKKIEEDDPAEALSAHADLETSIEAHNEVLLQVKEGLSRDEITEKNIDRIIAIASDESKKALENKENNKQKVVAEDEESKTQVGEEAENSTKTRLEKIADLKNKIEEIEKTIQVPVVEVVTEEEGALPEEIVSQEISDEEIIVDEEVVAQEESPEDITQEGKEENIEADEETVLEEESIATEVLEKVEPKETTDTLATIFNIESMKTQAETHIQNEEYGKAIIILEDIYQYLSKQTIVEKIKKEVVEKEKTTLEPKEVEVVEDKPKEIDNVEIIDEPIENKEEIEEDEETIDQENRQEDILEQIENVAKV